MKELRELTYDQLIEYSAQVNKEVRRRAYSEGYGQGKFDAEMNGQYDTSPPSIDELFRIGREALETPQQKRDRIVEQAKKDIEDLKSDGKDFEYIHDGLGVVAKFIVNPEKRTVVCLFKGFRIPTIYAKGIAKCAPDDCFNVHIGKAIALRRALGLEIPSEYLNVPQPTEVRVGDVVEFEAPIGEIKRRTLKRRGIGRYEFTIGTHLRDTHDVKIIDDSREVSE